MSKKGQDNQRGITFQNKVALFYMLNNYQYANFLKIKLEGETFEDFTLFFNDLENTSSFYSNFEVKNWQDPLTLNDVKKIIKKEIDKGTYRYSDKDSFHIIAPSFNQDCLNYFNTFQKRYLFDSSSSDEKFNKIKSIYQKDKHHPILEWSKEEILFMKNNVKLLELKEEIIDKSVHEHFHRAQSFYYTTENVENIKSRLFRKITEESSAGEELMKQKIETIITDFCNEETKKSESYDLTVDLGSLAKTIKEKLKNEDVFASLNDDRYIAPISRRERVIFYIIDHLKGKNFKFKKISWFFDKILIKKRYMLSTLKLLKKYAGNKNQDQKDKEKILAFMTKIYHDNFNRFYIEDIFEILLKLSEEEASDNFKTQVLDFLNKTLPDWNKTYKNFMEYEPYRYKSAPKIIQNIIGCNKKGIGLVLKKYNFTKTRCEEDRIYFDYIKKFINKDFKSNFPIVVKGLTDQFTILYKEQYGCDYKGYEYAGGGYSGSGSRFSLHVPQWTPVLSQCIENFYNNTKDWEFLKSIIEAPYNHENPVFVKRLCVPLLLRELNKTTETNPEDNKFYKSLESILEIKDGLPHTEDIVIHELNKQEIQDVYLNLIIKKILYKYSNEGVTDNILMIQLIIRLIGVGKLQFKEHLRKILLNRDFKNNSIYNQALSILDKYISNKNIKDFYNEIKNEVREIQDDTDIFYRQNLSYTEVKETPESYIGNLINSSSKKELDKLAGIINQAILKNDYQLIKVVLNIMDEDLNDFYKKSEESDNMKCIIAQLVPYANNMQLAEAIIDICVQDTSLGGESQELNNTVINGEETLSISSMRAHLCYPIESYIRYYGQQENSDACKKLKKAFGWIKTLMDLDGSLANQIKGFPNPNYYLRCFVIIPLTTLSFYSIRKTINQYQKGLGDEIKEFAFEVMKETEKEIKENKKYNLKRIIDRIGQLFDIIRDLNEEEAKKVLLFIKKFEVAISDHLFIWYALFREKHFLSKGKFNSEYFKNLLKEICKNKTGNFNQSDRLKKWISVTIYEGIENKTKKTQQANPDFDFFEKIKTYWILLFENITKDLFSSLNKTLAIILDKGKYYDHYSKYLFKLITETLKNQKESDGDYFLNLEEVFSAVSKHKPDDLVKILFLFLDKGNAVTGWIPFHYEVENELIPEIKKKKHLIQEQKIEEAETRLNKYNKSIYDKK